MMPRIYLPNLGPLRERFPYADRFMADEIVFARAIDADLIRAPYRRLRWLRSCRDVREGITLRANNPHGRVLWARSFAEQLLEHFGVYWSDDLPDQKVFHVTLISRDFLVDIADAPPDPSDLTRWARRSLSGFSHLGMVEPAYFTEFRATRDALKGSFVSHHGHALVWGCSARALRAHVAELNDRITPAIPHRDPVSTRRIRTAPDLTRCLFYLLKSPQKRYRYGPERRADGSIVFRQRKDDLRPAERIRLQTHLRGLELAALAFAGGAGRSLLASIKRQARRSCEQHASL